MPDSARLAPQRSSTAAAAESIDMTSSREIDSQEMVPTRHSTGNSGTSNTRKANPHIVTGNESERKLGWFLLLAPFVVLLMAAALLLISTPTRNLDDLKIAEWSAAALSEGWGKALTTVFFNLDLGVWQPRSYGLARAIQYVEGWLFGAAPVPAYVFIVLAHFGSGALIYQIVKQIGGDTLTTIFAAIAWMASPAVLPLLKVEHYFLYLIAPYYPLLGWVLLTVARQQSAKIFLIGASLLTTAWLLGEGVTVAIFVVVVTTALLSGSWRRAFPLIGQGVVAGLLLVFYLGYQHIFLRDPNVTQRFRFAPDLGLIEPFLRQLWQNGRAIIGLSHFDSELEITLGGIGVLESPIFWGVLAILIAFGIAAVRIMPRPPENLDHKFGLIIVLTWLSSLGLYLLFMMAGMGVFPARYAAAFFALMPVAIIAGLLVYVPRMAARMGAAAIAALSIALTLTSLYRAEVLVSKPNRVWLKELHGRAVILRPDSVSHVEHGAMPGLVPISGNGLANPMRSLWTAEVALRLYADATIGDSCRLIADDKAELFSLGQSRGIYPMQNFVVVGSSLTPEQVCK